MDEPIAIVGLDAKFPGDADTAERFYEFLLAGRSARTGIPPERYNADAYWHPDPERDGTTRVRAAHFLKGSISAFDAPFFSITPTEAASMDPQQRGMLECVYRALENAGIPLEKAAGSQTGVYVGCMYSDYDRMTTKDLDAPAKYAALGTVYSMLSNRVSWCFDLRGPSMTIDTACSSSLVALHQACNSLRLRESSMAIVGGCNLILSPEFTLLLDAAGVLGPDGRSHSFDHRANGYARGEGFGALVLKRVSDALRDGDLIRAVVRATGSNQDGRSPGITQPVRAAQAALIRDVYRRAGLDPAETGFFEAHGTGTAVGDPIEAGAIADVFRPPGPRPASEQPQPPQPPLLVGALKSNVGHLEGAAGVAAVIKGVLALERGVVPANAWFERRNPAISEEWGLEFPTRATVWPRTVGTGVEGVRRMSINSFGVGGSNAHAVMDDALHFLRRYGLVGRHRTVEVPSLPAGVVGSVGASASSSPVLSHADSGVGMLDSEDSEEAKPSEGGHHAVRVAGASDGTTSPLDTLGIITPASTTGDATGAAIMVDVHAKLLPTAPPTEGRAVATTVDDTPEAHRDQDPQLFVFSSYDQDGIARVRERLAGYLTSKSEAGGRQFLRDLSYTLACRRTRHGWRSFSVAGSVGELHAALGERSASTRAVAEPRLAFVFTGQGAQWPAMGRRLMLYSAFRGSLYAADEYMNGLGSSWSLIYELCKDAATSRIDDAEFSQPICTALQVALVDLLAAWNVRPSAVVGHSSGEIAAAYAAGHISRGAAWRISYHRGRLSSRLVHSEGRPRSGMAAVGLDAGATADAIGRVQALMPEEDAGALEIACMNSRDSHTVSGDMARIEKLVQVLQGGKVFARKLNVEIAYHSRHMRPIAEEYAQLIGDVEAREDGLAQGKKSSAFFSSLRGELLVQPSELQSADYWVDNLVSPVRFHEAVTDMLKWEEKGATAAATRPGTDSVTDILEIGPHSALRGPLRSIIQQVHDKADKVAYSTVLKRQGSAVESALDAAGSLFCRGFDVDLAAANRLLPGGGDHDGQPRPPLMLTDLPAYPFNHAVEHWSETRLSRNHRLRPAPRHELLGAPSPDWDRDRAVWRNYVRLSENPWVRDHRVAGDVLYPAAGMLVMAVEACRQVAVEGSRVRGFRFREVEFHTALRLSEDDDAKGVESHFYLQPARSQNGEKGVGGDWKEFRLCTFDEASEEWREHCRGLVRTELEGHDDLSSPIPVLQEECSQILKEARDGCTKKVATDKVYRLFGEAGLDFGPTFRTLKEVKLGGDFAVLARADSLVSEIRKAVPYGYLHPHLVHPSTLDAVLQANLAPLVVGERRLRGAAAVVPVYAEEFWISAGEGEGGAGHDSYLISARPRLHRGKLEARSSFSAVQAETGLPMVWASGLVFKALPGSGSSSSSERRSGGGKDHRMAYNLAWRPDPTLLDRRQASRAFGLPATAEDDPSAWMDDCEALCLLYVRRFLAASASPEAVGQMDWHHKRYVAWMEHVVETSSSSSSSSVVQPATDSAVAEMEGRVSAAATPEGRLVLAVGRGLEGILAGDTDPLDVIFGDRRAEDVYRHGLGSTRCYAQLCAYVDALAHKWPGMRILEVGGGTGGATVPVMDALTKGGAARFGSYDFTDISPSFFEHAKEAFGAQLGRMSFRVLNIERDPVDQGFEEGTYDLVLAANVLHATVSIERTLRNVRRLLRPGGRLVVFELTNPAVLLGGFCFGVLPGWWLSEEEERPWGPLMGVGLWEEKLLRCGFAGLDAVFDDFPLPEHQTSSVIVASVPSVPAVEASAQGEQHDNVQTVPALRVGAGAGAVYILADDASDLQSSIAGGISSALVLKGVAVETMTVTDVVGRNLEDGTTCVILADVEAPILAALTEDHLAALKAVVRHCKVVLWVTRGGVGVTAAPDTELVTGFARVVRAERPGIKFFTLSFAEDEVAESVVGRSLEILGCTPPSAIGDILGGEENSFRMADGIVHIPRLIEAGYLGRHIREQADPEDLFDQQELGAEPSRPLMARVETSGSFDAVEVKFKDDHASDAPLANEEVEFKTMAVGLGPHDAAAALEEKWTTSASASAPPMGLEAAGVVTKVGSDAASKFAVGDRVFGLCFSGALRTHARTDAGFLAKIPESMSWTDAACFPLAHMTAYAVLSVTGALRAGDSILVHAGLGDVALAAVKIARYCGATVFVVITRADQRLLWDEEHGLAADHIVSLKDEPTLRKEIALLTGGRGVDLVLDMAAARDRDAGWPIPRECVAPLGRFVQCGFGTSPAKDDVASFKFNSRRNLRFETFDAVQLATADPSIAQLIFQRTVGHVLGSLGWAESSPRSRISSYSCSQIPTALRDVQQRQSAGLGGKVVVELSGDSLVPVLRAREPPSRFCPDATYVIAGGLGGLGRSIARWMVGRGAKNLLLLSRKGPRSKEARDLVVELEKQCDKVATPKCDVTNVDDVRRVFDQHLATMPPVKGCIQGSMLLKDRAFVDMTLDEWNGAVSPKVDGSRNLLDVLHGGSSSSGLDFFVMLSSTVGLTGGTEQSNYAAGGTFQDALARSLTAISAQSPTGTASARIVSLDLPVILDVGFVAEKPELMGRLRSAGWAYMDEEEFQSVLDLHCRPWGKEPAGSQAEDPTVMAQVAPQLWLPQETAEEGVEVPSWAEDPLFSHLHCRARGSEDQGGSAQPDKAKKEVKYAALLAASQSLAEAEEVVLGALLLKLSRVLSVELSNLDPARPLHAYGVDSLVAVGLRAWLAKELGAEISVFEMTDRPSVYALAAAVVDRSRFVK